MSAIKQIRQMYGLTQQQLADYLGVSHGLLSMVEHGKRELPTAALLLLNRLQPQPVVPLTGVVAKKQQAVLAKQNALMAKALRKQLSDCTLAKEAARRQLEQLEAGYAQANHALQLVNRLLPLPGGGKNESLWLDVVEAEALKQLARCGEKERGLLQLKIKMLEYQMQLVQNRQDEAKSA